MRGLPAEGTWRKLSRSRAGVACLRQFETVERSGMEGPAGGAGHWRRWNGAAWNRLELAKSGPSPSRWSLEAASGDASARGRRFAAGVAYLICMV
jgi:hypothetical protein